MNPVIITTCKIKYDYSFNDCFITLPRSFSSSKCGEIGSYLIEPINSDDKIYCGWNGKFAQEEIIVIWSEFARSLGLNENVDVSLTSNPNIPKCISLFVIPASENDLNLIAENCQFITDNLNFRIRHVWNGLVFPFKLHSNLICHVKVIRCQPDSGCVLMEENTELCVGDTNEFGSVSIDNRSFSSKSSEVNKSSWPNFFTKLTKPFASLNKKSDENNLVISQNFEKFPSFPSSVMLKFVPIDTDLKKEAEDKFNIVYVSKYEFPEVDKSLAKLSVLLPPYDSSTTANSEQESSNKRPIVTSVLVMTHNSISPSQMYICPSLQKQLGVCPYFRLTLSPLVESDEKSFQSNHSSPNVHKVQVASILELIPLTRTLESQDLISEIGKITPEYGIFIVDGTLLTIGKVDYIVRIENLDEKFVIKLNYPLDVQLISFKENIFSLPATPVLSFQQGKKEEVKLYGFSELARNFSSSIASALKVDLPYSVSHSSGNKSSFIALIGPRGSGKTHLIKHCIHKYIQQPYFVSVKWIDCKVLRGRRVDVLNKLLMKEFCEVTWSQPSILILEELNHFTSSSEKPFETGKPQLFYLNRVSRLMIQIKNALENTLHMYGKQLLVIGTASTEESVHEALIKSSYFNSIYHLKPPDADDRKALIQGFISSCKPSVQLDSIADLNVFIQKTEGFFPVDLKIIVNKAIHYNLTSNAPHDKINVTSKPQCSDTSCTIDDDKRVLKLDHLLAVLTEYKPLNMRNIKLVPSSNLTLDKIGGLDDVKKTLIETIQWSSKYPNLMLKCPLRPASCILLYGPPGTGKTILAQAIANYTGLNFLPISGPELLSKYIGASELAIRDLFASAKAAKPCIVFFDEFDSIAPPRGHDSTGVTDRVVNQLLTQMDGVEGIDRSIFILAATSRPDLLDPALLRPGRFDLTLHCDLPKTDERLSILKSLVENINLAPDVNLVKLADQTEGFTGADLHAILYTAQMASARNLMNRPVKSTSNENLKPSPDSNSNDGTTFHGKNDSMKDILILESDLKCGKIIPPTDEIMSILTRFDLHGSKEEEETSKKNTFNANNNPSRVHNGASERLNSMLIQHKDIEDALESTKPSIEPLERERYSMM